MKGNSSRFPAEILKIAFAPGESPVKPCKLTGGDKPRPYLLGRGTSVGAGFIPARKGLNVD
jgi:hypothetical protein